MIPGAPSASMLILFDIDGTMLATQRAGIAAMTSTFEELAGRPISFEGVEVAGRLDVLIWREIVRRHELEESADAHDRFRKTYGGHLDRRLRENPTALAFPGVKELVNALHGRPGLTLGLLTGNYPETAKMKVVAAGFDAAVFELGAWGSDGEHRRDLPPVAMKRYAALGRGLVDPGRVVIIGDTPHDVDCAKVNGCRSIGVATGQFTVEQLSEAGADLAVPTLQETGRLVAWILETNLAPTR
jgi:phosphoglycolate phosphatase